MRKIICQPLTMLGVLGLGMGVYATHAMGQGSLVPSARSGEWVQAYHTRVRLIAGNANSEVADGGLRAGVHIRLDKGWKTYWRTPGGAGGVPPYFDWSGSRNLKAAKVEYPAPKRILSEDGQSIGYKEEVVFPIRVEPVEKGKPVELALRLDYGVCKEICVPVQSSLKLQLGKSDDRRQAGTIEASLVERFSKLIPMSTEKSDESIPQFLKAKADLSGKNPSLVIDAKFPKGSEGVDLFVEAPDGLYVALPEQSRLDDTGGVRFTIDLSKGEDLKYYKGKKLRFTFVTDRGGSEAWWTLPSR